MTSVSAIIVTYNHAKFIARALESVLAQDVECDIFVCDDCSTDGTPDIVRSYAQLHPDRINLIAASTNLCNWSLILRAAHTARGDYLALLDGDDFWTSPRKLSRQAAFLAENPDCSFCFHNVLVLDDAGEARPHLHNHCERTFWNLPDVLTNCFIQAGSTMFRAHILRDWFQSPLCGACPLDSGDWGLYVFAAERGNIGYLDEVMSVYRLHNHGLWSSIPQTTKFERIIEFYQAIAPHVAAEYQGLIQEMILKRSFDLSLEYERSGDFAKAALSLGNVMRARPAWAPKYIPGFHAGGWQEIERRLWSYQHASFPGAVSALQAAARTFSPPFSFVPQIAQSGSGACLRLADHRDCNIEYVNDYCEPLKGYRIMAASGGLLEVKGWAVDLQSRNLAQAVELTLAGNLYRAAYGILRPDVADYFGVPSFCNSGFRAVIALGQLPPGPCEFRVRILLRENGDYIESNPVSFEIVAAPVIVMDRAAD
jgi:glycosyltransferase involved in cell wall biosynthesis